MQLRLGIYEHYKGKKYRVLGVAKHSETLKDLVVYEALYDNEVSKLWVRPLSNFCEDVDYHGQKMPRFTPLEKTNRAKLSRKAKNGNK